MYYLALLLTKTTKKRPFSATSQSDQPGHICPGMKAGASGTRLKRLDSWRFGCLDTKKDTKNKRNPKKDTKGMFGCLDMFGCCFFFFKSCLELLLVSELLGFKHPKNTTSAIVACLSSEAVAGVRFYKNATFHEMWSFSGLFVSGLFFQGCQYFFHHGFLTWRRDLLESQVANRLS